ncbi:NAD(P)H-dependent flavin oxidoreductase [Flavobacterium cerinum]|uniref:Propionate 3-nitronate monooxygenase n=1 Tax=Flavobacterium cerinum TaxID=2502784 RepID=A0ABY5IUC3_9FLAO|nr:nitronate monooxygenase [Flavobacterium cerinum]UUC45066.1 nitronate monooxygenase [Flavobacterium cerinum]
MTRNHLITEKLQIRYPIVQAPMLGVTTPEMVAAIANEGGLGSLPVGGLSPEKTTELIRKTKQLTSYPFAVNLFAHTIPDITIAEAQQMQEYLSELGRKNGLEFPAQSIEKLVFYSYKSQIDILIAEQIPIVSFTFGIPDDESLLKLKANGILLIGTATCLEEALILDKKNIDIITAQGIEAGGHRGTFLDTIPLPQVSVMALVPQIVGRINKPVLASGAINDGNTIRAALAMGASGVQIGTAFIASSESMAIPTYKQAVLNAKDTDSTLTRTFSGRWARGLQNQFMSALDHSGLTPLPYPIQNSLTTPLRQVAQQHNNNNFTNMWSGQSAPKIQLPDCAAIFRELVRQTEIKNT